MVIYRIKISKKQWIRLAVFVAVIAAAALFDVYSRSHGIELLGGQTKSHDNSSDKGNVQLFSQTFDWGVKVQVLKPVIRKHSERSHDKFIQQFHQLRNYQVLKAEVQTQSAPLILSYRYLVFCNYYYSSPDDFNPLS